MSVDRFVGAELLVKFVPMRIDVLTKGGAVRIEGIVEINIGRERQPEYQPDQVHEEGTANPHGGVEDCRTTRHEQDDVAVHPQSRMAGDRCPGVEQLTAFHPPEFRHGPPEQRSYLHRVGSVADAFA